MELNASRKSKFFYLVMAVLTALSMFVSVGTNAYASENSNSNTESGSKQINLENNPEVSLISQNLKLETNENGIVLISIKDEQKLEKELTALGSKTNLTDIKQTINAFNKQLIEENGSGELSNILLLDQQKSISYRRSNSGMCPAIIGGAGLAHTTLYGAAAWALGVTGPAGWIAGAAIGAAYYGGSLLC